MHLKSIYNHLGAARANALLGFHALTGTDMSGRFAGKSKKTCFKSFMTAGDDVLAGFASLGTTDDPTDEAMAAMELFVCKLYAPKGQVITNLPDCRWFLFSQKQAECEKLPPTLPTFKQHVRRANLIARIWMKADEPHPELPIPTDCGWTLEENRFVPIMSTEEPAPKTVLIAGEMCV